MITPARYASLLARVMHFAYPVCKNPQAPKTLYGVRLFSYACLKCAWILTYSFKALTQQAKSYEPKPRQAGLRRGRLRLPPGFQGLYGGRHQAETNAP